MHHLLMCSEGVRPKLKQNVVRTSDANAASNRSMLHSLKFIAIKLKSLKKLETKEYPALLHMTGSKRYY